MQSAKPSVLLRVWQCSLWQANQSMDSSLGKTVSLPRQPLILQLSIQGCRQWDFPHLPCSVSCCWSFRSLGSPVMEYTILICDWVLHAAMVTEFILHVWRKLTGSSPVMALCSFGVEIILALLQPSVFRKSMEKKGWYYSFYRQITEFTR